MEEFKPPWLYNFPPFYTIQVNKNTLAKQLDAWCQFVLDYCRHYKCFELSPKRKPTSFILSNMAQKEGVTLFTNPDINRTLSRDGILLVLEDLDSRGNFKWFDKHDKTKGGYVLWHSIEDWSLLIHNYIVSKGMKNTVCTFYELIQAPIANMPTTSKSTNDLKNIPEFAGMPQSLLLIILKHLETKSYVKLYNKVTLKVSNSYNHS